ncbi:thrombospondin type 1 domain protein, partial [Oesophagostomum dentatum]
RAEQHSYRADFYDNRAEQHNNSTDIYDNSAEQHYNSPDVYDNRAEQHYNSTDIYDNSAEQHYNSPDFYDNRTKQHNDSPDVNDNRAKQHYNSPDINDNRAKQHNNRTVNNVDTICNDCTDYNYHTSCPVLPFYWALEQLGNITEVGNDTKVENCNIGVCYFPRLSCCSPYVSTVINGKHACGPQPNVTEPPIDTSCCPANGFWAEWGEWSACSGAGCFKPPAPVTTELPKCENGSCCVIGGVWSEWSSGSACSDSCGYCGTTTRTRGCISEQFGCPCSGPSTKTSECAPTPCLYPRASCCGNRTKLLGSQNTFECSKMDDNSPPASDLCWTCCPSSGGYWSEWTEGGACGDTCGSCAQVTQKRTCLTEAQGCACRGPSTREKNCNIGVCYYPRNSCCTPYSSTVIDGKHACGPQPNYTTPLVPYDPYCNSTCCPDNGIWSEWTQSPNQCSDYCGSCGNMTKTRTCLSAADGCPCNGESTVTAPCGTDVCYYPRLSCCPGFASTVIEGRHACGPLPTAPEDPPYINTCGVNCCPTKGFRSNLGIWGEWSITVPCNDTCGSCGTQVRSRKCLSLQYGCACTGDAVQNKVCGTSVCLFPRTTCCPGYTKKADTVTKTFYCGPLPVDPVFNPEQTTCCDPEKKGLWNEWTEWSKCTSDCGLCGTQARNRTCASQPYGCPCQGSTTETKACGQAACTTGQACCTGYPAVGYDGANFCQPNPPAQCPGTWTAWMAETGATCNDTCGMCGALPSYRYCWPSGCQCSGAFKANQACGSPVCTFPRTTCCAPYVKKIVNKQFVCA